MCENKDDDEHWRRWCRCRTEAGRTARPPRRRWRTSSWRSWRRSSEDQSPPAPAATRRRTAVPLRTTSWLNSWLKSAFVVPLWLGLCRCFNTVEQDTLKLAVVVPCRFQSRFHYDASLKSNVVVVVINRSRSVAFLWSRWRSDPLIHLLTIRYLSPPPRRLCCRPFVCVLATLRKNFRTDLHENFREGWPMNKLLNFGNLVAIRITDLDTDPDPDPYRDTGKTCLGGGMHCPSASCLSLGYHKTFVVCLLHYKHTRRM